LTSKTRIYTFQKPYFEFPNQELFSKNTVRHTIRCGISFSTKWRV
jgi:hypothetical protein